MLRRRGTSVATGSRSWCGYGSRRFLSVPRPCGRRAVPGWGRGGGAGSERWPGPVWRAGRRCRGNRTVASRCRGRSRCACPRRCGRRDERRERMASAYIWRAWQPARRTVRRRQRDPVQSGRFLELQQGVLDGIDVHGVDLARAGEEVVQGVAAMLEMTMSRSSGFRSRATRSRAAVGVVDQVAFVDCFEDGAFSFSRGPGMDHERVVPQVVLRGGLLFRVVLRVVFRGAGQFHRGGGPLRGGHRPDPGYPRQFAPTSGSGLPRGPRSRSSYSSRASMAGPMVPVTPIGVTGASTSSVTVSSMRCTVSVSRS